MTNIAPKAKKSTKSVGKVSATVSFDIKLAKKLIDSSKQFPISLDDAWIWLGYAEKRNALDTLKSYFEEGFDFSGSNRKTPQSNGSEFSSSSTKTSKGGRPSDSYFLTVNCFKELGMLAKTAKGKEIRKYFLECERIAKQQAPRQQDELSRILDTPNPWEKMYDKKFCDRISKTYGYKFYREVVYALLTPKEYLKMDKLSETKNGKKRDHCLHQLIEPETKERMKPYLEIIQVMLNSVNTMEDFNRAYFRQFGVWIEERYRDLMEGYWDIVYQEAQESKARYELGQIKRAAKSAN